MAWACCKNGWYKDSKHVTGGQTRRKEIKGRPTIQWIGNVESDLRKMGIKIWRTRALDRTEWVCVMKKAKVKLKGPQCSRTIILDFC
jgi:hypothetical protein